MSFHSRAVIGALDQALMAAAHFVLGVMVARLGGISELGSFAFAYTVIVMANMLHGAVIGEIYSIDATAKSGEKRSGLGFILTPTLLMALALVAVAQLLLLWGEEGRMVRSPAFIVALIMSMCLWSGKIYFYCNAAPFKTLMCTAVYGVSMLATTYLAYRVNGPDASPFTGVAVGGTVATIVLFVRVRRLEKFSSEMRAFVAASLKYARWSVPAATLIWFANNGYYLLMPAHSDLRQTAGLRAILNLMVPLNTLLVGASTALLPVLAETLRERGKERLVVVTHWMALTVLATTAVFALAMVSMSSRLLGLVYGDGFIQFAGALKVASVLPMLWGIAVVYRTSIRALGESFDLFKVYLFALFPVGITLMLWLSRSGADHAVIGVALTQVLIVAGFIYRFVVMTRSSNEVQLRQG